MSQTVQISRPASTNWSAVCVLVGAGIVAALQIGKAVIATPMLRTDMGLDLAAVGWLTGVFAFLGLVGGVPAGAFVAGLGSRRMLLLGLLTTAAGAALGAVAVSFGMLLASRVIEGMGFLLITVAAPSIIEHVAGRRQRDFAFALWSCFMPAGMAIAMLAGPLLFDGWRAIWWAGGALAIAAAAAVVLAVPADQRRQPRVWSGLGKDVLVEDALTTLRAGAPLVLAAAFAFYSLMFFALFSFLPVLLMERMQVTHQTAGMLSAVASMANIAGNLAAGVLLSRGVGRPVLLAVASLAMGAAAPGIFLPVLADAPTFALCVLFSAVGGVIPATLLSTAPLAAPAAGLVSVVLGLVMQGNNLGQIVGPVAVGGAIEAYGWGAAALIVVAAAIICAAIAAALGYSLRSRHRKGEGIPAENADGWKAGRSN